MKHLLLFAFALCALATGSFAQKTVGLDNWFNHETNAKTGKIFHYTWDDQENSGFSQLGDLFLKRGAKLSTISTAPNSKSMKGVNIYIIVDPDTTKENPNPNYIRPGDIKFLKKWVNNGGVLLLMGNDGPNCEFTHFNQMAREFGFYMQHKTLNPVTNKEWDMAAETKFINHPLFWGVKKVYLKEVAPIVLSKNAKPVLYDADTNSVIIAETSYGKGYVLFVSDPWLYNEYIDHAYLPQSFENLKAANNLVDLLLKKAK